MVAKLGQFSIAERVFNYLHKNPSQTLAEIQATLTDIDTSRTSGALVELFKKGLIGRHPTPNPNGHGLRRTVYRYWTTADAYVRNPPGNKKSKEEKPKAKKPQAPQTKEKIRELVNDWDKDSPIRPAPAATPENTVHHNVTVRIEFPPALMRLIEKLV